MTASAGVGVNGGPGAGTSPGPQDRLEERLDRLTAQVEQLAAVLQTQQEDRERRQALVHDLTGVAQGVMAVASRELEDLSADVSAEDVVRFLRTATRTLPKLEVMLTWAASIEELAAELTAISGAGMATLSGTLAEAESRGYFAAAKQGGRVADRMAQALLTAPEPEPPSTLALLRRLRDPQTRRGLARALVLLQALGEPPAATTTTATTPAATARP